LLALRAGHPKAWLLAGGTDLGLRVSEHREKPPSVIGLLGVPELQALTADAAGITIGAAVPYARLLPLLDGTLAPLAAMMTRLGSRQIRAMGTVAGNLGTASPIGDALPALLALGATVIVASLRGERRLPVAEFLLGYRKTALASDEVITAIHLPRPPPGAVLAVEKISKRHDQDISAVSAGFLVTVQQGRIARAVLAFGGVGATALRAAHAEGALSGALLAPASFDAAADELVHDIAPLSDLRGSSAYRLAAAQGLLRRLYWRVAKPELAAEVHAL
jgi:xanthine dehydrogenase small subunit